MCMAVAEGGGVSYLGGGSFVLLGGRAVGGTMSKCGGGIESRTNRTWRVLAW